MKSKNQSLRASKNNFKNSTEMQSANDSISSKSISVISGLFPKCSNQILLLEKCSLNSSGLKYDNVICAITLNCIGFFTENQKDRFYAVSIFNILSLTKFSLTQNNDESLYLETSDAKITIFSDQIIHIARIIVRNYAYSTILIPNNLRLQFDVYDHSLFPTPSIPFSLSQIFQFRYFALCTKNNHEYNHSVVQYFHSLMKTHNPIFNFKHLPTAVDSDQIASIIQSLIDIPVIAGISCRNSDTPSIIMDICPLIEQSQYIQSIKLMNCNASEGINELAEAFSANKSIPLQQLYLNDNDFEDLNPLINSLASLQTQLTHLSLTEAGLNEESLELLSQSLLQAESLRHLTFLGIGGCEFNGDYVPNLIKYIQTNKNLTELDISGSQNFSSILEIIPKSKITTLNLADCIFDDQSVQVLMNISQYISNLDLSGCNLNYMEISQVIPNLGKKQNSLLTLKINRLNFSSERSFAILRGFILSNLEKWKSIEMDETKITSNELLGYQALFLKMNNLEHLSFRSNFVEKDAKIVESLLDIKSLKSLILADSKLSSLIPSIIKSNLISIDLSSNEINDTNALKLLASAKLQKIKLNDNPFDNFDQIIEAANKNKNLVYPPLKNGLSYIPYQNELFSSAFNENVKDFHLYHHTAINEDINLPYPFVGNSYQEEIMVIEDTSIYDSEKMNLITIEDPSPSEKVKEIAIFPDFKQESTKRKRRSKPESSETKNASFPEDQSIYSTSDASSSSSIRRKRRKHSSHRENDENNIEAEDQSNQLNEIDNENNSPETKLSSKKRIQNINLDDNENEADNSNSPEIKSSSKKRVTRNEFDENEDDYSNAHENRSSSRRRMHHNEFDENVDNYSNSPEIKSSSKRRMHHNDFDENEDNYSNAPENKTSKRRIHHNEFDENEDDYSNSLELRKFSNKRNSKKDKNDLHQEIESDEDSFNDENNYQDNQMNQNEFDYNSDSRKEEELSNEEETMKQQYDYSQDEPNEEDDIENENIDQNSEEEQMEIKQKEVSKRKSSSNTHLRNLFDSTSASEIQNPPKKFLHEAPPPLNEDDDTSSETDIETFEKRMQQRNQSLQKAQKSQFDSSSDAQNEENQYSEKEQNEENEEEEQNEENQYSEKEQDEENEEEEQNEENQYNEEEQNEENEAEQNEDNEEEEVWVNMTSKTSIKSTASASSNSVPKRFTFSTDSSPIHPSAQSTASSASPSPQKKNQTQKTTEKDNKQSSKFDSNEEDENEINHNKENQYDSNEEDEEDQVHSQNNLKNLLFSSELEKIKKKPSIFHNEEEDEELLNIESVDGNLLNRNARTLINAQQIHISSESDNEYDIQNLFISDNENGNENEQNAEDESKQDNEPEVKEEIAQSKAKATPTKRQSKIPMPMNSRSPLRRSPRPSNENEDNNQTKPKSHIPSPSPLRKSNEKLVDQKEEVEPEIQNASRLERNEISNTIPDSHPTLSEEEFAFSKKVKMNKEREKSPPKARLPKQILHDDYGMYSTETEPHDNSNLIMNTFLSDLDDSLSSSAANPNPVKPIPEKKEKKKKDTISKKNKSKTIIENPKTNDKTQFHPPSEPECSPEESLESVCDFLQLTSNMFTAPKRRKEKQINPILLAFSPPTLEIE